MQPLRGRRGGTRGTGAAALDADGFVLVPPARFFAERMRAALDLRGAILAEVDARRLFLWIPVCMGVGILLFSVADGVPSPWPALAAALLAFAAAFRFRARLAPQVLLTALGCIALGFGCMAHRTAQSQHLCSTSRSSRGWLPSWKPSMQAPAAAAWCSSSPAWRRPSP